jgi:hypothetical protein
MNQNVSDQVKTLVNEWIKNKSITPYPSDIQLIWLRWILLTDPKVLPTMVQTQILRPIRAYQLRLTGDVIEYLQGVVYRRMGPLKVHSSYGAPLEELRKTNELRRTVLLEKVARYKRNQSFRRTDYPIEEEEAYNRTEISHKRNRGDLNAEDAENMTRESFARQEEFYKNKTAMDALILSIETDPYLLQSMGGEKYKAQMFLDRLRDAGYSERHSREEVETASKRRITDRFQYSDVETLNMFDTYPAVAARNAGRPSSFGKNVIL